MAEPHINVQEKRQDVEYVETVSTSVSDQLPNAIQADTLARRLTARQVQMIAIGGTIGTGLFLGTGKALHTGGPASLLLAYLIMGGIVFMTMVSLGEMASFIPIAGSFCTFAGRFVDDSVGFTLTWIYWFNCAATTAADVIALQLLLRFWSDTFPGWAISLIFLVVLLSANLLQVGLYGEIQYWLSLLKVVTIVIFIILGIVVNCGANTEDTYIGGRNWHVGDAPFVGGVGGFASVFVTASFAYGGTESIAITAGETQDPSKNMPKVVKTVFWRILFFYVLSALVIGLNVPYDYPGLSQRSSATSPFTIVFVQAGSKAAGSFINAVVLTSVISAGNHALFAGSRMLFSLAVNGHAPKVFKRQNKYKLPWVAVIATSSISFLCFGASYIGAGELWSWLQNIIGVSNQITWLIIGISSMRFRAAVKAQDMEHLLPFKNWTYPIGPALVIILNGFLVLVQGWSCFAPVFSVTDFLSYYLLLPVMAILILVWKFWKKTRFVRLDEMDLLTDRYDLRPGNGGSHGQSITAGSEDETVEPTKLSKQARIVSVLKRPLTLIF